MKNKLQDVERVARDSDARLLAEWQERSKESAVAALQYEKMRTWYDKKWGEFEQQGRRR